MIQPADTDKRLRQAILDLLEFFAPHHISLDETEILHFLPVKASPVGVNSHLRKLLQRGKLRRFKDQSYGLKVVTYARRRRLWSDTNSYSTPSSAQRVILLARVVPFIKSVAICSDDILNNEQDNPRLIFIILPSRIYITKDILRRVFYRIKKDPEVSKDAGKSEKADKNANVATSCRDTFYTTAGLRFVDKMGSTNYEKVMWFALAEPIYGKQAWETALQRNDFIRSHLPNYPWHYDETRIFSSFNAWLDDIDNTRYRHYLRQMAKLKEYKTSRALLRIRPDVFIARSEHLKK